MSDYTPSPELVEAAEQAMRSHDCSDVVARNIPFLADAALSAAVAFRHPDGHPELVPWEQVRELVKAARAIPHFVEERRYMEDCWGESVIACHRSDCDHQCVRPGKTQCGGEWDEFGCWYHPDEYGRYEATAILRAALAPFTQEPQP